MKTIEVHFIDMEEPASRGPVPGGSVPGGSVLKSSVSEKGLARALERIPGVNRIDEISWKDYPYLPEVTFKIARTAKGLLLRYNVKENHVRAVHTKTNDPVYKDSCVEFFLSTDEKHYYNFEFNCIGTALIGFGTSREDRKWIEPGRIEQIRRFPSLGRKPFSENVKGNHRWELSIFIPFSFFKEADELRNGFGQQSRKEDSTLERGPVKRYRANFYKCGDELSVPHYVSWNRIETAAPDFHRPEYFGELVLVE